MLISKSVHLSPCRYGTPVMRTMALMLLPSTRAETTCTRFSVLSRFTM